MTKSKLDCESSKAHNVHHDDVTRILSSSVKRLSCPSAASRVVRSSLMPQRIVADVTTDPFIISSSLGGLSDIRSNLLKATTRGVSAKPSCVSSWSTTSACSAARGLLISTTCSNRSDHMASSRVALNASIKIVGNLFINPTVSLIMAVFPDGRYKRRVVVSNVSNSLFLERISEFVNTLNSADFPALVYPTTAMVFTSFRVRLLRCEPRWSRTLDIAVFSSRDLLRMSRRSVSICDSPGPLVPIPPPSLSKCDHCPAKRGIRYSTCASSTCSLPSLVRARLANMSSINAVRSMTLICKASSNTLCCAGVSSSSHMTVWMASLLTTC